MFFFILTNMRNFMFIVCNIHMFYCIFTWYLDTYPNDGSYNLIVKEGQTM